MSAAPQLQKAIEGGHQQLASSPFNFPSKKFSLNFQYLIFKIYMFAIMN